MKSGQSTFQENRMAEPRQITGKTKYKEEFQSGRKDTVSPYIWISGGERGRKRLFIKYIRRVSKASASQKKCQCRSSYNNSYSIYAFHESFIQIISWWEGDSISINFFFHQTFACWIKNSICGNFIVVSLSYCFLNWFLT